MSKKLPSGFYDAWEAISKYREEHKAAVDSMGVHTAADAKAPKDEQDFQTLFSLMLSSQTKDITNSAVMTELKSAPDGLTLEVVRKWTEEELDEKIKKVGFHRTKAKHIKQTAELLATQHDGKVPDTLRELIAFPGVGPKMAHLALQICHNITVGVSVDTHVHRITNRLGWVKTKTPIETMKDLEDWLPKDCWAEINPLLVGYGQTVCQPRKPKCDICPARLWCKEGRKGMK
ncbi:Endonuclease III-like protein 1 [Carpediemonas membranifera]|uniref:Endonuclease III homolog n=1 Tax=Carpediemonas membranifera TaxID=201153 RepID=A0A8J6B8S5_9EUKA|nr:Endonuclease III-like protein 1 [Carpediemonas membranifera]|eukprot:KAG9392367.1 Endonuclease III-like protein 1 [Carpediemonas membranifera]